MQRNFLPYGAYLCLVRKNRFLKPCEKYYKRSEPKRFLGREGYKYAEKWKIMWKSRDNTSIPTDKRVQSVIFEPL